MPLLGLEKIIPQEQSEYKISGAILGCLGKNKDKVQYEIVENLPGDPWIAIIRSKGLLTYKEVRLWHKYHVVDVDKKGVPYYFIVTHIPTKKEFVWYSDDINMMPINAPQEKKAAIKAGIKKGLDPKQLDF